MLGGFELIFVLLTMISDRSIEEIPGEFCAKNLV